MPSQHNRSNQPVLPKGFPLLVKVTPAQLKLLGKPSVQLYRSLRYLRGQGSVTTGLVYTLVELKDLTNLSRDQLRRGLARLREAGAIRSESTYTNKRRGAGRYIVYGKIKRGELWLPETIQEWCASRKPQGRPARIKDAPLLAKKARSKGASLIENSQKPRNENGTNKFKDAADLQIKHAPSLLSNNKTKIITRFDSPSENSSAGFSEPWPADIQARLDKGTLWCEAEAALAIVRPEDPELGETPSPLNLKFHEYLDAITSAGDKRVLAYRKANPRPHLPGRPVAMPPPCSVPKVCLGYDEIPNSTKGPRLVKLLLEGHREATQAIYGESMFPWWKGKKSKSIEKMKGYANLLKAAQFLQYEGIAPGAWSHWRLVQEKEKSPSKKPLGPVRIHQAAFMEKWVDFFFSNYNGPQGVKELWTDDHRDQLYRQEEAILIWQNKSPNVLNLVGTRKYRDKRKQEIAAGHTNPRDCWSKVKTNG